jgi:hypothetical protein
MTDMGPAFITLLAARLTALAGFERCRIKEQIHEVVVPYRAGCRLPAADAGRSYLLPGRPDIPVRAATSRIKGVLRETKKKREGRAEANVTRRAATCASAHDTETFPQFLGHSK